MHGIYVPVTYRSVMGKYKNNIRQYIKWSPETTQNKRGVI